MFLMEELQTINVAAPSLQEVELLHSSPLNVG